MKHQILAGLYLACAGMQAGAQAQKAAPTAVAGFATSTPEAVGFSTPRLDRLDATLKALVDSEQLAGMVTVLARHGKIVDEKTYGYADLASQKAMQKDTIARIYSMTKPITGVAMMMLYEEASGSPVILSPSTYRNFAI